MNKSEIYTITTFYLERIKPGIDWEAVLRKRTVGFFHEFALAEQCVLTNNGDIWEDGYYTHAVIERVDPGLYSMGSIEFRKFYEWKDGKFVKCETFDDPEADVASYSPIG